MEKDKMNQELVRIVDNISRDKNIDRESIFQDLEAALISAARKYFWQHKSAQLQSLERSTPGRYYYPVR